MFPNSRGNGRIAHQANGSLRRVEFVAGRVTPSAVRIFAGFAFGSGSFVTVVFPSIVYCNRHKLPSEVIASRSVVAWRVAICCSEMLVQPLFHCTAQF